MYYGKITRKLKRLLEGYEAIFGYNPNGDMELELGDSDYRDYIKALKESIKTGNDIICTFEGADY